LRVEAAGALEWFPCETIVFDGALARVTTRVELAPDAAFIGWDLGCFGRPASQAGFFRGELRQTIEIARGGELLVVDRSHVVGGSETLTAAWGYAGEPVYGTLYCTAGQAVELDALAREVRAALASVSVRAAVTVFDGVLVVRALGAEVERVRAALVAAWRVVRPCLLGRQALLPRIWAT
jgi:urease accessory protein